MRRNLWVIICTSALFGTGGGLYEFVLPFYLEDRRLSFHQMGIIFSLASGATVLLRVYLGGRSQVGGRKWAYSVSVALCSLAVGLKAVFASLWPLTALRTLREGAALVRDAIHPTLLYENVRRGFVSFIGKARMLEFSFMAAGTALAGVTVHACGNRNSLVVSGLLIMAAFVFFTVTYGQREAGERGEASPVSPGATRSSGLSQELKTLVWSGLLLWMGSTASHSFIMPLFFTHKFGVSEYTVRWVMAIHRLTIIAPMLLLGRLGIRDLRTAYIVAVMVDGLSLIGATLMPTFTLSAAVWLMHDFAGGGIWAPIQYTLVQRFCRGEDGAAEANKVLALMALGGAIGPYLAGLTAGLLMDLPFALSGVLMLASVVPMIGLVEPEEVAK